MFKLTQGFVFFIDVDGGELTDTAADGEVLDSNELQIELPMFAAFPDIDDVHAAFEQALDTVAPDTDEDEFQAVSTQVWDALGRVGLPDLGDAASMAALADGPVLISVVRVAYMAKASAVSEEDEDSVQDILDGAVEPEDD